MKSTLLRLFALAGATSFLVSGCGNSSSTPDTKTGASAPAPAPAQATPPSESPSQPAAPAVAPTPTPTQAAAPAAAPDAAPAPAPATAPAAAAAPETQPTVSAATAQLTTMAKTQDDQVLSSVGTDLADKVKALTQAGPANPSLNSQLTSSVQSLVGGKDSSALGSFYQAAQSASLTPQQTQLAKEVGNLATAFVVQRNFSNLQGSQGDVATIVNSLRKGELTAAVPALQNVAQNANLTPPQKDLIGSIADKYAPGLSKAAGTVQQGLQGLRNLGK